MTLLTVENADFGYAGRPVLRHVSLSVSTEDFIGLIGPNGAGKSTLIRSLLGLLPPLRGEVRRAHNFPRHIGYVPQRGRLDPIYPLAVRDVVAMGYDGMRPWYRLEVTERHKKVNACLEKVGLAHFERRLYAELSGGQQQRVLIARALATEPRFLILDEPTSGVDPAAEKAIMDLLLEMNRRDGIAVLLVSHKIPMLRDHATMIWIAAERRVSAGPAAELLAPDRLAAIMEAVF